METAVKSKNKQIRISNNPETTKLGFFLLSSLSFSPLKNRCGPSPDNKIPGKESKRCVTKKSNIHTIVMYGERFEKIPMGVLAIMSKKQIIAKKNPIVVPRSQGLLLCNFFQKKKKRVKKNAKKIK